MALLSAVFDLVWILHMAKGWHRKWIISLIFVLIACLQALTARAELKTHQIKAAYLYQISKFVFWPEERKKADAFSVCQLGPDLYQGTLEKMQGRTVFNKPIQVLNIQSLDQAAQCHLLILSSPNKIETKKLRLWLADHHVLTVVDGAKNGDLGMVAFVLENQRVRLHINLNLAEHSGLAFAANLLEVASHIERSN
jgi:hypothetical protein